eukprot:g22424.t1
MPGLPQGPVLGPQASSGFELDSARWQCEPFSGSFEAANLSRPAKVVVGRLGSTYPLSFHPRRLAQRKQSLGIIYGVTESAASATSTLSSLNHS